jgi:hypothetical protein
MSTLKELTATITRLEGERDRGFERLSRERDDAQDAAVRMSTLLAEAEAEVERLKKATSMSLLSRLSAAERQRDELLKSGEHWVDRHCDDTAALHAAAERERELVEALNHYACDCAGPERADHCQFYTDGDKPDPRCGWIAARALQAKEAGE